MQPYFADDQVTLYGGDCREILQGLPADSVDAVVCDPPYELVTGNGKGFMGRSWDATGVAFDPNTWRQVMRVLKPGGHLLAFGGSRTWHRMVVAIEDAGFEIRDSIAWLYSQGFPKSLDISKAIDKAAGKEREILSEKIKVTTFDSEKQAGGGWARGTVQETTPVTDDAKKWDGWGTALKPSFEPIAVARKPLEGTHVTNVLKYGTGALNISGCRLGTEERINLPAANKPGGASLNMSVIGMPQDASPTPAVGRWPSNVALDPAQAAVLDEQTKHLKAGGSIAAGSKGAGPRNNTVYGKDTAERGEWEGYDDAGGASRFFKVTDYPVFKYEAKADKNERPSVNGVVHSTVKPVDLMRWLIRLVTPPGGIVLDPFAGSGTTGEAAIHEHKQAILIELEDDHLPLIVARLSKPMEIGFDFGT